MKIQYKKTKEKTGYLPRETRNFLGNISALEHSSKNNLFFVEQLLYRHMNSCYYTRKKLGYIYEEGYDVYYIPIYIIERGIGALTSVFSSTDVDIIMDNEKIYIANNKASISFVKNIEVIEFEFDDEEFTFPITSNLMKKYLIWERIKLPKKVWELLEEYNYIIFHKIKITTYIKKEEK